MDNEITDSVSFQTEETFIQLFEVIDRLSQRGMSTSPKKNVMLLENLTVRQQKSIFAVNSLTIRKPEGVNLKDLAERLNMTVPATSVLVESMVQKNLFERYTNPRDRRAVCIRISEFGLEICEYIKQQMHVLAEDLVSTLTIEEKSAFAKIVHKFYQKMFF